MSIELPRCFCHKTTSQFVVDGSLKKQMWQSIAPVQLAMYSGAAPTHKTEVRALWNEDQVCFGFDCEDPEPNSTMTKRDDPLFMDSNLVEVFLDPRASSSDYLEFEVNTLGTIMDLYYEYVGQDWEVAINWHANGARAKTLIQRDPKTAKPIGWSAELCIPFQDFPSIQKPRSGDVWRANFYRYNTVSTFPGDHLELYAWSPTLVPKFGQPHRFGYLTFVDRSATGHS